MEQDDGTKISRLLANHVLKTGEKLNLSNAYSDTRFDPLVDTVWSFKSENLLCMPIRDQTGGIIGCAQITNRMDDEPFDENDEQLFEAFCIFCGLAINNSIIFNQLEASMAEKSVALDVLSYHATVTKSELNNFMEKYVPNLPKKVNHVPPSLPKSLLNGLMQKEKLASYIFDDFSLNSDEMIIASYEMFQQSGLMKAFQIERNVPSSSQTINVSLLTLLFIRFYYNGCSQYVRTIVTSLITTGVMHSTLVKACLPYLR